MKVPYDINFRPFRAGLTNSTGVERIRSLNTGRFDALLDAEMKDLGASGGFSLGKTELQRLIRIVQGQINDYLIRSVLEAYGGTGFSGSLLEGVKNLPGSPASENRHPSEQVKSNDIDRIVDHASKKYEVEPKLIKAVIKAESDFDAKITSHKGAMGLMQLMPETAKELGVKNPYDPVENVMGGTRYLKMLLDRYDGDTNLALAAYNWGMGNVERNPGKLPQETKTYITRINKYYRQATA